MLEDSRRGGQEVMEEEELTVWTIVVKLLEGRRIEVTNVNPNSTVLDFKILVRDIVDIPIDYQRLLFCGKFLKNADKLKDYSITHRSCVHLLKRANVPSPRRQPSAARQESSQTSPSQWNFNSNDLSRIINDQLSRSRVTSRRLGKAFPVGDNVEHIYQGLATLDTMESSFQQRRKNSNKRKTEVESINDEGMLDSLLASLDDDAVLLDDPISKVGTPEIQDDNSIEEKVNSVTGINAYFEQMDTSKKEYRQFKVGQWIDVLDTVSLWLEATVTQVLDNGRKIRVHYNGWGTRWDEVIETCSPRIARFRTMSKNHRACPNFSPTISHWVDHTPKIVKDNKMSELVESVEEATLKVLEQLRRVKNNDYDNCSTFEDAKLEKLQDIMELAPKLDIIGRSIADLGRVFANRPNFKRREDYVKFSGQLIDLVRLPLIPFGLKTSFESDRTAAGEWNRNEHHDLLRNLDFDDHIACMTNGPNELAQGNRAARNLELHLHTIVAPDFRNSERQSPRTPAVAELNSSISNNVVPDIETTTNNLETSNTSPSNEMPSLDLYSENENSSTGLQEDDEQNNLLDDMENSDNQSTQDENTEVY